MAGQGPAARVVDEVHLSEGVAPQVDPGERLPVLPAAAGLDPVVGSRQRPEVADGGLPTARSRPGTRTWLGARPGPVGLGVVDVHPLGGAGAPREAVGRGDYLDRRP